MREREGERQRQTETKRERNRQTEKFCCVDVSVTVHSKLTEFFLILL